MSFNFKQAEYRQKGGVSDEQVLDPNKRNLLVSNQPNDDDVFDEQVDTMCLIPIKDAF